jgi:hypothetical protein
MVALKQMLRYASHQNWTIGQLLIRLGRTAEAVRGSTPSEWITNASESEIRDAAALSGVVQLEIKRAGERAGEKESPREIKAAVDRILRVTKPQR